MANSTFTNTSGGNWSASTNWSAGLPDNNTAVSFSSGTYTSVVDSTGTPWVIQSLNVNIATVTLAVDVDLTVQTLEANSGTIDIESGATLQVGSINGNAGEISVSDNGVLTVQNLNSNIGNITAGPTGLVNLQGTGTGNFTVSGGVLAIAGNYNGSGLVTMDTGVVWVQGQLGSSSYNLDDGGVDQIYFDSLQSTTNNAFSGADLGDRIGIKNVTISSANYSGTILTLNTSGGTYTFTHITIAAGIEPDGQTGTTTFQGNSYGYIELACYRRGTMIATPAGEVPIEALTIGERVLTQDGAARQIKWIGQRSYNGRFIAGNRDVLPIRIAANAIADGVPHHDLDVSPKHAMLIDDVLVPAELLVNDASIWQLDAVDELEYFHIELEEHNAILAEGAPSETFVDCDNRGMFQNAHEFTRRYPRDARPAWRFCAERLDASSAKLRPISTRLAARAGGAVARPHLATRVQAMQAVLRRYREPALAIRAR